MKSNLVGLLALASLFATLPWASAGASTLVPPPCLAPAEKSGRHVDLKACDATFHYRDDHNVPAGTLDTLQAQIKKHVDCYYQGYNLDTTQTSCEQGVPIGVGTPSDPHAPSQVCDLSYSAPGWNQNGEFDSNHIGRSCGDWEKTRESSYFMGLLVPALRHHAQDLFTEIQNYKVKIGDRCKPIADDYMNLRTNGAKISAAITQAPGIPDAAFTSGIDYCKDDPSAVHAQLMSAGLSDTDATTLESNIPKAAICYMSFARTSLESMFNQLTLCELWDRVNLTLIQAGETELTNLQQTIQSCVDKASKKGHDEHDEDAGKREFHRCYKQNMEQFFRGLIPKYMPAPYLDLSANGRVPAGHPAPGLPLSPLPLLFAFGTLAADGESRKKRVLRLMRKTLLFLGINGAVLSVGTYYALGGCCGDDCHVPQFTETCLGMITPQNDSCGMDRQGPADADVSACCDPSNETANAPDLATDQAKCKQCIQKNHGGMVATCLTEQNNANGAANAGALTQNAQSKAGSLVGLNGSGTNPSPTPAPTGTNPNTFANNNNGQQDAASDTGQISRLASGPSGGGGSSDSGPSARNHGGSAAGGGGTSGGGGATADLSTSPSADAQAAGAGATTPDTNDKDGAYAGGGNGGASKDSGGSRFGMSSAGGGAGGATDASFGTDEGAKIDASGSEDPADYFARTNLDASLFKIVHEKLTEKAHGWEMQDLHNMEKSKVKAAPKILPKP